MVGFLPKPLAHEEQLTPQQVEALRQRIADATANRPLEGNHWSHGVSRLIDAWGGYKGNQRADREEAEGTAEAQSIIAALMGGGQSFAPQGVAPVLQPAPLDASGVPDVNVAPVNPAVAGAFSGRSDMSALPASLIQSESGGNLSALNSEGYGGRGQFGAARLADAARAGIIPSGMTGASYSRAPEEVQQRVEAWHRADILNDLGQYVGVDVDGAGPIPPLTEDSILAVAHLGGTGGAQKFIQSGGRYDPADSNGTNLSDYAKMHAGGGAVAPIGNAGAPSGTGVSPVVQSLMQAQANPWVQEKYGPVIGALMEQEMGRQNAAFDMQMKQQDPAYQIGLQKAQLELQALQDPPKPIEVGGVLLDGTTYQPIYDSRQQQGAEGYTLSPGEQRFDAQGNPIASVPAAGPEQTDDIREYEYARANGYAGSFNDFMLESKRAGAGRTNAVGAPPVGYRNVFDQNGNIVSQEIIPGGPADVAQREAAAKAEAEKAAAASKSQSANNTEARTATIVVDDIRRARQQAQEFGTTGLVGAGMKKVPGSRGYDLRSTLDTVKANIGFDRLQQMREESPTGGALGSVTENELRMLSAVMGSLEQEQSGEQLARNLERLEKVYSDILKKAAAYPNAASYGFIAESGGPADAVWNDVGGVKIRKKQ